VRNKRILLADDNDDTREVMRMLLVGKGAEVVAVKNGLEAVVAFERSCEGERFDVVVLDGAMPKLDGFSAAEGIRSFDRQGCGDGERSVRIAVYTAYDEYVRQSRLLEEKTIDAYWVKPRDLVVLSDQINGWLDEKDGFSEEAADAAAQGEKPTE